jgi:MFS family permease
MTTTYLQKLRLFSRDVRLYLISAALAGFSYFGIYVVLFNLYLLRLGYGPQFIGLVNGVSWLPVVVFSLPAGALGRRWGARRAMAAGMILSVAGLGMPPLAEFVPTPLRAVWLLATYSLSGIGWPLWSVNGSPFLMSATSPEERSHAFSMLTALFPLAGFAGSLTGGLLPGLLATVLRVSLDDPAPYRYPLLIAAVLLLPAALALLATGEVGGAETQEAVMEAGPAPWGLMVLLAMFAFLRMAGEGATYTFFNVYLDDSLQAATSLIGLLAAVSQLLSGSAALAAPLLISRWGRFRTVVLGPVGAALSLLPLALIPHWGAAGLGFMGVTATSSMTYPAFAVYHQELVPPHRRPTMAGAITTAMGLSGAAVSLGGGYVVAALGYPTFFLIAAGLAAGGALLFWVAIRVPCGEVARTPVR